jgi:hypothetical protein
MLLHSVYFTNAPTLGRSGPQSAAGILSMDMTVQVHALNVTPHLDCS